MLFRWQPFSYFSLCCKLVSGLWG